jgi:transcription elongation factor GreA
MNADKQYLSKEKFEELRQELEYLKHTRRKEVAESLEHAKSLGDLSENAEYQEAREAQAAIEDRISMLDTLLKSAVIISKHNGDVVEVGSTVTVEKVDSKEKRTYQVVGSEEADMGQAKISNESPLGSAMIGKKKDDVFTFKAPSGEATYKVLSIE